VHDFKAIYFVVVNLLAFLLMGVDKYLAIRNRWRISENALHFSALLGGIVGMVLGIVVFRHKIRKKIFLFLTGLIITFQLILVYYLIIV
jgi:uncharacterized membrane protein YsdA (DUF1294 family)